MGRISTGVGLVSGINSKDIIDQLMAIESRPKDTLQTRIDSITQQKLAYTDLQTRLTGLKLSGTTLKKTSTFQNAATSSSDENVLTATASPGAAVGSYQFQVARLVTTQQGISRGFADFDSAKVGAGNITIELGGGDLAQQNVLSELRGGEGVRRGIFKITDRSGATAVIDTTAAVSLDDVLKKINTNLDISVKATLDGDKIVLSDTTGKTASNLIVQDVGEGHAAEDLGLVGNVAANSLNGTDINFLGRLTSLAQLNDGRGVRHAETGDNDFTVALGDGTTFDVSVRNSKTLADVIDAINTAGGGKVKAEIVPGANGIHLADLSGGTGGFEVLALNGSKAAADLGIETTTAGNTIDGSPLLAGLGTVLLSSLNGGAGLTLGTINIKSRAAGAGTDIDLSGSTSVADMLKKINDANVGVKASLNAAGNGLQITDSSGGAGDLVISDAGGGTVATDLGLAGTFDTNTAIVNGANLQRAWVSENTLLADYNGGKGVTPGKFRISDSLGHTATVDLTQGNEIRLADVIQEINSKGIGITASINAHGDGLLLTDTAGGDAKMKVEDLSGTAAADLNIKGTATATTIDGSMEKTIAITANDTLQDIQKKVNDLNWGVSAQIINDGSATAPYRLSINALNPGRDGRVVFDGGATTLQTRTLVEAQDAAVFVGGSDAAQPLLITASKNQLAGVIKGVNVDLHGVSDKPVTLSVTRNIDNVVDEVKKFAQNFNDMIDKMADLTKFDTDTNTRGLLLGEGTVETVQTEVYGMLQTVNVGGGRYRVLGDVGLTLGEGAKIVFDEDKFRAAYATDPDSVQNLFTEIDTVPGADGKPISKTPGIAYAIETRISKLIDPVNGVIPRENKTLDNRTQQFQDRMSQLDDLLTQKRTRLEKQFANLESVLANLQSQQSALGGLSSIRTPTPTTSSK
jgi:flagellar hook-associated protein 2